MQAFTLYVLVFSLLSALAGCGQTPQEKAFKTFNEGVTFSLDALHLDEHNQHAEATSANKKAVEKFQETLRIDSTHHGARVALGHSFYLLGEFGQAITWFESANKLDEQTAINLRELGLSRINLGQVAAGRQDLEHAFQLDTSAEIRAITVDDLYDIGKRAFDYSGAYTKQGEVEKGQAYQQFSFEVLELALRFDASRRDVATTLVAFAEQAGNKRLAATYRKLLPTAP